MKIIKRNGTTVDFDASKIYNAMSKAASSVYVVSDDLAYNLQRIARSIESQLKESKADVLTISMVQALVEEKVALSGGIYISQSTTFLIDYSVILSELTIKIKSLFTYD